MKLNISERGTLYNLLPKEGDFYTLKEIRRAKELLSFTAEENAMFLTKTEDGKPALKQDLTYEADIPCSEFLTEFVRDLLQKKSQKHNLLDEEYTLYEKFVVQYV